MKFRRKDIELMAPVGSFDALQAALDGGADSVYFGVGGLNMRSRSSVNFTLNDLTSIVGQAHSYSRKAYLTLNVVVFDNEREYIDEVLTHAAEAGIDAIIASDMAVILAAQNRGMKVHLSTQMNISNYDAIRFYSNFAETAVLARELSLEQIGKISECIAVNKLCGPSGEPFTLEIFVHGALCMSISGKCYLSLHNHNHSANRGACLQDCRRAYQVSDRETGMVMDIENEYIMSPRDLCTIHFLNKILDSGVRILKIEGRARPPEYVNIVTRCYNEALLAIESGDFNQLRIMAWHEQLSTVFNRGFWDGYYLGQRLGEWSSGYGSTATRKKEYAAKGMNYFSRLGVAEFHCESGTLMVGDEILIIGPTTGVVHTHVEELRVNLEKVTKVSKGDSFSMPVAQQIRRSDKLYRWVTHNQSPINE